MREYKRMWRYSQVTLRNSLRSISTYITLLLVFLMAQYYCPSIGQYLRVNGDRTNLWELYIWSMSTRPSQLLYLAAVIGISCQVMRISGGLEFYLLRMSRRAWIRAQAITLFWNVVGVNLFLLCCFVVGCRGQVTWSDQWSRAAFMAVQFHDPSLVGMSRIFHVSPNLLSFSPNAIGLLSFLLAVALGMVMGLTMMLFSLLQRTAYGGIMMFSLWMMDTLAGSIPRLKGLRYLLPFGMGRVTYTSLNYGSVTPTYCIVFLLVLMVALLWLGDVVSDRVDFGKIG